MMDWIIRATDQWERLKHFPMLQNPLSQQESPELLVEAPYGVFDRALEDTIKGGRLTQRVMRGLTYRRQAGVSWVRSV